jgi:hypothetical protein
MTNIFDKLKLRPFERRLVVAIGIVLFLVAQFLFIWPHFGAVKRMNDRREIAKSALAKFGEEFAQTNKIATELAKLAGEGAAVPPEEQSSDLMRSIQSQASQTGVVPQNVSKAFTRTNDAFFLEQSVTVTTLSTEEQLLNFLYNLGSGNSLIRVRGLTMRPDQTRTKLSATVTLVASYQKKPATRAAAAAAVAPAPAAAKPPAPAAAKPPVPAAPKPAAPTTSTVPRKKP